MSGFSINSVSARCGVAKRTIASRWPDRESLITDGLSSLADGLAPPRTGRLVTDLVLLAEQIVEATAEPRRSILARCAAELQYHPRHYALFRRETFDRSMAVVEDVLFDARARGDLRADVDLGVTADCFVSAIMGSRSFGNLDLPAANRVSSQLISIFVRGTVVPSTTGADDANLAGAEVLQNSPRTVTNPTPVGKIGQTTYIRDMGTDPRTERTRRHIRDAVIGLSEEGNGVLTVSQVARRAGVNRSTFYAHFDSLEHVALELLDEALASIVELGWRARVAGHGAEGHEPGDLLALVEHVAHRRRMYVAVLTAADSAPQAQLHVAGVLSSRFEEAFLRYGAAEIVDASTVRATAIAVGAAMAALVTAWLRGDLTCSQEGLAEQLASVLPAWTHQLHHHPGDFHE
ncbi:hypothetical protein BH09ACT12_BH09ACT12_12930 [soil metagenome]